MLLVLLRKKPVERISFSNVAGIAPANAAASRYFLNKKGVTMFTRLLVHCALKIVAIRSCNGFLKSSSQCASGYTLRNAFASASARTRAVIGSQPPPAKQACAAPAKPRFAPGAKRGGPRRTRWRE